MATDADPALPQMGKLRKTPSLAPSESSRRSSSVFQGQNVRSKGYWNNLMCMLSGLSSDPNTPAVAAGLNRDYFGNSPSPSPTPVLRALSSTSGVTTSRHSSSSLRPSFTTRHSSRSLLRRLSTRSSGVSFQIQQEVVPNHPVSPCETVPEEQLLPSAFENNILSTIPDPSQMEEMISFERDGKTVWMPAHVVDRYSLPTPLHRPASPGRLKISIPTRTASKAIKQPRDPREEASALALVNTASSHTSSVQSFQTGSSNRSNRSSSGSSADSPSVHTPGSVYSSDGTSLISEEIQTPTDTTAVGQHKLGHKTSFSVIDPSKAGVFDEPPPVQPRNPRRSNVDTKDFATPTLVQAQGDLEDELLIIDSESPDAVQRLAALYQPASAAPVVPQRSRHRASQKPGHKLTNCKSVGDMSLAVTAEQSEQARVTADAAERVIFHLFLAVTSLGDLFALAQINHGFYAVYKRYEYLFVKNTLRNDCLAAWEVLELTLDANHDKSSTERELTLRYLEALRQDIEILQELKTAILERCTSFLRPNTISGLSGEDADAEAAVDDALWRIWAFCSRFHEAPAAVDSQVKYLADNDVSAEQLYNMTEVWNCIVALLSGIPSTPGAVEQARAAGIISADADIDGLEAWIDAQRMRGPSVALDLASVAAEPSADVFALAAQMGWTQCPGGDANAAAAFLKDAVARAYAARLTTERAAPPLEPLEIASPTPVSPARASPLSALEPDAPLDVVAIDESAVHPALRRQTSQQSGGFVTPPTMPSAASSSYSTRPVTPA